MGSTLSGVLPHFELLRETCGGLAGLALLRAVLTDGPLGGRTALVSSFGAESAVLLDMVARVDPATPVIFLDTGKLFAETHVHRQALVDLLRLSDVRVVRPEQTNLAERDPHGDLWQRDPDACCHLRKTAALEAALVGFDAWITGRKRFQGGLRWRLPTLEPEWSRGRIKINPLAPWSAEAIERYRVRRNLPKHPLAERGYRSIGCVPCTRPVSPKDPQRAGRWCGLDKSECGIHLMDKAS
jgi:phosphoadenosine phosphosulfate reductase